MSTDRQTLQELKKEMTPAINKAANAAQKPERIAAANHAKALENTIFQMRSHYQNATKESLEARKLLKRDDR